MSTLRSRLRTEARVLAVSVVAILLAFAVTSIFIAASGSSIEAAYRALWDGAFGSRPQMANTIQKLIPLYLVALGWIVAFAARRVNIGLEGQMLIGALGATVVGLHVKLPAVVHLPLATLAGAAFGAAWAGIAAWLWARRGVNEIISTLLLNFVAVQLVAWMLRGPLAGGRADVIRSDPVHGSAQWPTLLSGTPLTWAVVLIPLALVATVVLLRRTVFGYRIRFTGANTDAARTAGIRTTRVSVLSFLISGGLAGVAGSVLVLGSQSHALTDNVAGGMGYSGIVAALLGGNGAVLALPASLLLAVLAQGGGLMEARTGVSTEVTGILQASVILLVAAAAFLMDRRRVRRVDADADPEPTAAPAPDATASDATPTRSEVQT